MVFITSQSVNAEIMRQRSLNEEIAKYQQQVSTARKFEKPSDNPQDWIQISLVGRQQSLNTAWQDNLKFAQARAQQAQSGLDDVNQLMTKVTEALVTATSQGAGTPGSQATAVALRGLRESITAILNQTDYQGTPTFDNGTTTPIPIGKGLAFEAVGTRQDIEGGITTASGTKTIYQVLDDAIAAIDDTTDNRANLIKASLGDARAGVDHIIIAVTRQGVRSQRLERETDRLLTAQLNLAERRSNLEDTDLSEAISKIQAKLTSLQAAQAAFAKINQQSLFDLIR